DDLTAYRLLHGYAEGRPGLTIDRYGDTALIAHKVDIADELEAIVAALRQCHPYASVIAKAHRYFNWNSTALSVTALHGELPTAPLVVIDNGLRFATTPHANELTGLFLDARAARAWIRENSMDRRVLNLFAYTGSLGVAAAAGGARSVVHVDSKKNPLQVARENHRLNDLAVDERGFLCGDVYRHLPRASKSGAQFDGIVLDPPPRVPERQRRRNPDGQDYAALVRLVIPLLAPRAWLLCFFHRFDRTRDAFEREVIEASDHTLRIEWRGTSGPDFPENDPERKLRLTAFVRS
ncbi:MAG: class I SAM-dependent methyltransferase, partial [Planctomycetes bacterium]|nr:class I SAM-dependent methyltransferase [Planctomycetota bacterium]